MSIFSRDLNVGISRDLKAVGFSRGLNVIRIFPVSRERCGVFVRGLFDKFSVSLQSSQCFFGRLLQLGTQFHETRRRIYNFFATGSFPFLGTIAVEVTFNLIN